MASLLIICVYTQPGSFSHIICRDLRIIIFLFLSYVSVFVSLKGMSNAIYNHFCMYIYRNYHQYGLTLYRVFILTLEPFLVSAFLHWTQQSSSINFREKLEKGKKKKNKNWELLRDNGSHGKERESLVSVNWEATQNRVE